MSTRFRCCHCARAFGEADALCEDWNDPRKSFICPACGTYLLRADQTDLQVIEGGRRLGTRLRRWLPLLPALAALIVGAVLFEGIWGDRGALAVLLLGGVGIAIMAVRLAETMAPQETVRVSDLDDRDPRLLH